MPHLSRRRSSSSSQASPPPGPRVPSCRNSWLNVFSNAPPVMGTILMTAILDQDATTLSGHLWNVQGVSGRLAALGAIWVHEGASAAAAVWAQGFDVLRPALLEEEPERYRVEILNLVGVAADLDPDLPAATGLVDQLHALLSVRPSPLELGEGEAQAHLKDDALPQVHAVLRRLEARALHETLGQAVGMALPAVLPRARL